MPAVLERLVLRPASARIEFQVGAFDDGQRIDDEHRIGNRVLHDPLGEAREIKHAQKRPWRAPYRRELPMTYSRLRKFSAIAVQCGGAEKACDEATRHLDSWFANRNR